MTSEQIKAALMTSRIESESSEERTLIFQGTHSIVRVREDVEQLDSMYGTHYQPIFLVETKRADQWKIAKKAATVESAVAAIKSLLQTSTKNNKD